MKCVLCLAVLLHLSSLASAESANRDGESAFEATTVERGTTFEEVAGQHHRAYGASTLDPGLPPEGDYLGEVIYTLDGERILCTNAMSDNVTVMDASTRAVITNIDVGWYPHGIAVTNDYAIVACAFGDEVWVIDLDDYSIAGILPTGEQPWVVRTSPGGRFAYVSCDIENTCEKIDLLSMSTSLVIPEFPVFLLSFGFTSEQARIFVKFTNFELTPDGSTIVVGNWDDSILFYNATTGDLVDSINGIANCVAISLSGGGWIAAASSSTNPMTVHRVNLSTRSLVNSVTIAGKTFSTNHQAALNQSGSKAFVSVTNNQSALVRFDSNDYVFFSSTYSAFWVGTSPDHSLAISGQYRFSIIDFDSETMIGQHQGNSQNKGAVSPIANEVASIYSLLHEGVYFYEFPSGTPSYLGTTNSGLDAEGDAPRRVAITPDGSKAVITNVLSDNVTILDLSTYQIDAILDIGDRVQNVEITSDSRWAVVCGFNSNSVKIIDLESELIVADVPCGTRAGVVTITPDNSHAYIGDIQANTISVVELNGAASTRIATIPCGTIGVLWTGYGVMSDVEASPTGEYVLVAASFDDQVKVIETASNTIVATLDVGLFPLQIAFDATGDYAMVTNQQASSISVLGIDGAVSSVISTDFRGTNPLRLAYDPVHDEMGVVHYTSKTLVRLDPRTGALLGTRSFSGYGEPIQVLYDENGEPLVLTRPGNSEPHLHRGLEAIPLPANPAYFDYNPSVGKAVAVMPGPDYATVVVLHPAGAHEVIPIALDRHGWLNAPQPQPVNDRTRLGFRLKLAGEVAIDLVDPSGRRVKKITGGHFEVGDHTILWHPVDLVAGTYFAVLRLNGAILDSKQIQLLGAMH